MLIVAVHGYNIMPTKCLNYRSNLIVFYRNGYLFMMFLCALFFFKFILEHEIFQIIKKNDEISLVYN